MADKKKNGTKIYLTRTNISILVSKKEKILCTLRQNHYRSRKNECSFFKSIFPFKVSLFRLFTFDISLVLILLSCSVESLYVPSVSCTP